MRPSSTLCERRRVVAEATLDAVERSPTLAYPSPRYAWMVVILLTIAYALSLLDRWVLTLLVGPIKSAMSVSDTAMGLLMGPMFAFVYLFAGLPFGWAADRFNRRNLVAGAISFWSMMTALSGLARSFYQLAICRFGIGFGEAALNPSATSVIADIFPRRKVNIAIGVYDLGVYTGMGLSYLIGGALLAWATSNQHALLGGSFAPWQIVFIMVGVPGIGIALLLLLFVREPARRRAPRENPTMRACMAHIRTHRAALVPLAVGMGTVGVFGYGFTWLPTLFARVWQWPVERFSLYYGLILLILGPLGTVTGGIVANKLYAAGRLDAPYRVLSFALPCVVLIGGTAPYLVIAALGVSAFFSAMSTSAGVAAVIFGTPAAYRGRVLAIYTVTNSMIGTLIGPTGVGLLNDYVFKSPAGIRYSLPVILLSVGGLLTMYLTTGRRGYERAVRQLEIDLARDESR
jgi:MFS family permease